MVKIIFSIFFCFIFNYRVLSQNCDSISFFEIESMPYFKGDINEFITNHLRYPKKALNDSISGTVYVLFIINEDGKTSNHKILKGIREDLNNEALRVSKLIKFEQPAINDGKPIKYKYLVPIKFELSGKHRSKTGSNFPLKEEIMIEKIVVYEDFYKAGSTALLKNVFESPLSYEVDTVFVGVENEDESDFGFILNNADVKKHKQMKINVDLALLVTIQSQEHHIVISESSNVIIDLTDNLNYRLNTDELQNKAKEFVQKYD